MNELSLDCPQNKGRLIGIDVVKVYAIIMVVLTHCYAPEFLQARYAELWIYNAVPFFLMIGAFFYSRKYHEIAKKNTSLSSICKVWFVRKGLKAYFKRISVPYLVFMLAQVITLPLVGYATFDVALLNTVKGGMGPGGYYLVVYVQLFILSPFLNKICDDNPLRAGLICFTVQYLFAALWQYLTSISGSPALMTDINKYLVFRFLIYFYLGIILYKYYRKISAWHINATLTAATALKFLEVVVGGFSNGAISSLCSTVQGALWCFGLLTAIIYIFDRINFKGKAISFLGGTTLHILLFQQIYFCVVGVGRHKAYIDAPIALVGGVVCYLIFAAAGKIFPCVRRHFVRHTPNSDTNN